MKRVSTFNSQLFIGVVPFWRLSGCFSRPRVLVWSASKMWLWFSTQIPLNNVSSCSTCLGLVFVYLICEAPETSQFLYQAAGLGPTGLTSIEGMLQIGIFIVMLPCVLILPELMLKFVAFKTSQIHLNNCTEFAWGLTLCFDLLCWMSFFLLNPSTFRWISRGSFGCHFFVDGSDQVCSMWHPPEHGASVSWSWMGDDVPTKQSKKSKGKSNLFWGGCRVQLIRVIFVLEFVSDQCYRDFYLKAFNKSNQTNKNPIPLV